MNSSATQQQREQRILGELNAILHTLSSISYVLDEIEHLAQTSSLTGQQEAIHQLSQMHTSGTGESEHNNSSPEDREEQQVGAIPNVK